LDPFFSVVADNHTFWKLKYAVYAKFIRVTLIPLQVPRVGIHEQVADIQNTPRAKYPPNLREQLPLIIIAGYTGEHSEQDYSVKGPITEGQHVPVISNECRMRELRTALHEHLFGKVRAHDVPIAGTQKRIK